MHWVLTVCSILFQVSADDQFFYCGTTSGDVLQVLWKIINMSQLY